MSLQSDYVRVRSREDPVVPNKVGLWVHLYFGMNPEFLVEVDLELCSRCPFLTSR